jgi:hypothetical protein
MTDFRARCAELVELDQAEPGDYANWRQNWNAAIARARAALAQPEPPADGEVAELVAWLRDRANSTSLAHAARRITRAADLLERLAQPGPQGPTDEELRDLWSWAACQDQGPWPTQQHCFARAVLARWGRPAIEPVAPTDEELETTARAAEIQYMKEHGGLAGLTPDGLHAQLQAQRLAGLRAVAARFGRPAIEPVPEPGEVEGIAEWLNSRGRMADLGTRNWYFRAATLFQQQAAPVPVSERLPGPEDCDAEGRCWMCGKVEGDWRLISTDNPGVPQLKYAFSHWLPHWALPVPGVEGKP